MLVMDAMRDYIRSYFGTGTEASFLIDRADDLAVRLWRVDQGHKAWMNAKRSVDDN